VLRWALRKNAASIVVQFGCYLSLLTTTLVLTEEWLHVYIVPQPLRYHLEMELGITLVLAFGVGPALYRAAGKHRAWLTALLILAAAEQFRNYRHHAHVTLRPADITKSVEFEVADWLQRNLPNQRIFATGSTQFWLNLFADNPQVGGGFAQGALTPVMPMLHFGIPYTAGDGESMAMLLRVLGAHAVVVSGPAGRDGYREVWRDPGKFRGVLPELWREGGDAIYGVPQRSLSPAHAIRETDIVRRAPVNVADLEPLRAIDAAMEDFNLPLVAFDWHGPSRATITAALKPEEIVFVQVGYHPGWHARRNGSPLRVDRDALGFILLRPQCDGPCRIELQYDGGTEMRIARLIRAMSLTIILGLALWSAGKRHFFFGG
jgi:hypothetical protein